MNCMRFAGAGRGLRFYLLVALLGWTLLPNAVFGQQALDVDQQGPKAYTAKEILNKHVARLQGADWSPKKFFGELGRLIDFDFVISSAVLKSANISPRFSQTTAGKILDKICKDNGWEHDLRTSINATALTDRLSTRFPFIKVRSVQEREPVGKLILTKAIELFGSSPDEAAEIAKGHLTNDGIVYVSARRPLLVVQDTPEAASKAQQAVQDADRQTLVTEIVEVERDPKEIIREVESMLPEQEDKLLPDPTEKKIYIYDAPETVTRVKKLIEELDGSKKERSFKAVVLDNRFPEDVIADLLSLMPELEGTVKPDPFGNKVILTGDPSRWEILEKVIAGLDRKGLKSFPEARGDPERTTKRSSELGSDRERQR